MASRSSSSSPARRARRKSGPDRESIRPRAAHHRARQAHARWRPPGPSTHDNLRWIPPFPPVESATKAVQKRLPSTSTPTAAAAAAATSPARPSGCVEARLDFHNPLSCFIQRTPFFFCSPLVQCSLNARGMLVYLGAVLSCPPLACVCVYRSHHLY
jgi:hypothetical protein